MFKKPYIYILYIILFIYILFVSILAFSKKQISSKVETKIEYRTKTETVDRIIYRKLPAKIDTVIVFRDSIYVQSEIASIDTVVTSKDEKSRVYLNIEYDEFRNLFDIESNFISSTDSVFIEKIVKEEIVRKPKFLRPTVWLGSRFDIESKDIKSADINAGLVLLERYSTTIGIDNHRQVLLRFGVNF